MIDGDFSQRLGIGLRLEFPGKGLFGCFDLFACQSVEAEKCA
jgi:hypothetical protein